MSLRPSSALLDKQEKAANAEPVGSEIRESRHTIAFVHDMRLCILIEEAPQFFSFPDPSSVVRLTSVVVVDLMIRTRTPAFVIVKDDHVAVFCEKRIYSCDSFVASPQIMRERTTNPNHSLFQTLVSRLESERSS